MMTYSWLLLLNDIWSFDIVWLCSSAVEVRWIICGTSSTDMSYNYAAVRLNHFEETVQFACSYDDDSQDDTRDAALHLDMQPLHLLHWSFHAIFCSEIMVESVYNLWISDSTFIHLWVVKHMKRNLCNSQLKNVTKPRQITEVKLCGNFNLAMFLLFSLAYSKWSKHVWFVLTSKLEACIITIYTIYAVCCMNLSEAGCEILSEIVADSNFHFALEK